MSTITAAEVNKLRQITGAGMMDCKKALTESEGDFDKAIEFLRKKGQKVAASRSDRSANEGVVIAQTTSDNKRGVLIVVNCETDFVAKNEEFTQFVKQIAQIAIDKQPKTIEELKALSYNGNGLTVADKITEQVGKIGEKIDLTRYEIVEAAKVSAYIHPGNKLATVVGFNKTDVKDDVLKDIAMQVAAMAPVALDKSDVSPELIEKELEIARDLIRQEGKPEDMIEKIAQGKINKFFKESTLLNQEFIKDSKKTVAQYLKESDNGLAVTAFKRYSLS
jgi:elongation factor Ts